MATAGTVKLKVALGPQLTAKPEAIFAQGEETGVKSRETPWINGYEGGPAQGHAGPYPRAAVMQPHAPRPPSNRDAVSFPS